jgi:hypothetical protein
MTLRVEFDPANKILLLHFEGQLLDEAPVASIVPMIHFGQWQRL